MRLNWHHLSYSGFRKVNEERENGNEGYGRNK